MSQQKHCGNCQYFKPSRLLKILNRCGHPNTKTFIRSEIEYGYFNNCGSKLRLYTPIKKFDAIVSEILDEEFLK